MEDGAETQAVVFVSDRSGAALRRRERCLKLAGIAHTVLAERRPSGTYYKLCVQEKDAVAAHLALQMGGCGRSLRLREPRANSLTALREVVARCGTRCAISGRAWSDLARRVTPRLLSGPRETTANQ